MPISNGDGPKETCAGNTGRHAPSPTVQAQGRSLEGQGDRGFADQRAPRQLQSLRNLRRFLAGNGILPKMMFE
jgi:hypothetical protein